MARKAVKSKSKRHIEIKADRNAEDSPRTAAASGRKAGWRRKSATKKKTATKASGSRKQRPIELLLLADAEWLEDLDHARGVRASVHHEAGQHLDGRSVQAGIPGDRPNNRMPAIVDPDGPGGKPISVFESGAILQYLGRKTGKFYPANERERVEVEQWLMWQMGGLGSDGGAERIISGNYAPEQSPYAIDRYDQRGQPSLWCDEHAVSEDRPFLAGHYSIADMACVGWASRWERQGQDIAEFPHFKRWLETLLARRRRFSAV